MSNKITLTIAGFNLIVNTSEDEERVRRLNAILNEDLQRILEQNPNASVTNAALLCSLDYLDRCEKANHSANNLRSQIKDYLSDAAAAKLQLDDQRRKNSDLDAEIQTLRSHLTKLAAEDAAETTLKKELEAAKTESSTTRAQLREQLEQNKLLSDKADAMNSCIAQQEEELKRLSELCSSQTAKLEEQTRRLFTLEQQSGASAGEQDALRQRAENAEQAKQTAVDTLARLKQEYDRVCAQLEDSIAERERLLGRLAAKSTEPDAPVAPVFEQTAPVLEHAAPAEQTVSVYEQAVPAEQTAPAEQDEPVTSPTATDEAAQTIPTEEQSGADRAPQEEQHAAEQALPFRDLSEFPTITLDENSSPVAENGFSLDFSVPEEDEQSAPAEEADAADEADGDELGVGEGFKTFGQMIAEELGHGTASELVTPFGAKPVATNPTPAPSYTPDEEDDLPDLSWINDID